MDFSLQTIKPQIVQSIRAIRLEDLQRAALGTGQHFLYADLSGAQSKQEVLDALSDQFMIPGYIPRTIENVREALSDSFYRSGQQMGFVVMLENIPVTPKFDKEAREQFLDFFREIADFWAERKVPFRCFYSFALARSVCEDQLDDLGQLDVFSNERLPTNKLVDISPQALRMSSPFNSAYWLTAA